MIKPEQTTMCRRFFHFIFLSSVLVFCNYRNALSQTDTVQLDSFVLAEPKATSVFRESGRIIRVISREELKGLSSATLQDVLEYSAGLDIRQRGTDIIQADISIRGGTFDQVLVLLNGVPVNDPQTGHHSLDIPVDLPMIARIEILKGAGSRKYGAGAFSGAINFITVEPGENKQLRVNGEVAEYNTLKSSLSGQIKGGSLDHSAGISYRSSGGYTRNTDFRAMNFHYEAGLKMEKGSLRFMLAFQDKAFGANSFYTPKYPDQFEHTATLFSHLKWVPAGKLQIYPELWWRVHHDRFELFRNESPAWYLNHNYHLNDMAGGRIGAHLPFGTGSFDFAVNIRNEAIRSNVLGELTGDTVRDPFDKTGFFTRKSSRLNLEIFSGYHHKMKKTVMSAGFTGYWNSFSGAGISAGADVEMDVNSGFAAFASIDQGFRLPTFTDLYYSGPVNTGNPGLVPEKSVNIETGFKYRRKSLSGHFSVFRRWGKDIIDWVKDGSSEKWQSMNHTGLTADGTELYAGYRRNKEGRGFIKSVDISYTWMFMKKQGNEYISYYVLDYLNHKVSSTISLGIYRNIFSGISFSWQKRNGTYTAYPSGEEISYQAFYLTDIKAGWEKEGLTAFLKVSNLFDQDYMDFGNITMPGRWIGIGVIWYMKDYTAK